MKFRATFLCIMLLSLIPLVYGVTGTVSSFTDQTNPFNIKFVNASNYTYFLNFPTYSYTQNVTLNISNINGLSSIFVGQYPDYDPFGDLYMGFHFNQTSGNVTDIKSFHNASNIKISYTPGYFGNAVNISISDSRVQVYNFGLNYNFTFSGWYNYSYQPYSFQSNPFLFGAKVSGGSGTYLYYNLTTGRFLSDLYDSTFTLQCRVTAINNITDKNYHHIVLTNDGNLRLYIDGNLINTSPSVCDPTKDYNDNTTENKLTIGNERDSGSSNSPFSGNIDDFLVFNKSLSFNEIFALYSSSNDINNLEIYTGDSKDYSYSGILNSSQKLDLTNSINNILSEGCICTNCSTISSGICGVPISFSSSTLGIIKVNLTNATYEYGIDDCSTYGNVTFNASFFDENSLENINASGDVVFSFFGIGTEMDNLTISFTNVTSFNVCLFPQYATLYTDAYFQYEAASGIKERYYIVNASFTNTTQYANLYNFLDDTNLLPLTANLFNYYLTYYPNIIMKLQRYYPGQDAWITVQIDKSDQVGRGIFYVYENEIDYRFIWEDNNVQLDRKSGGGSTFPLKFVCDPITNVCEESFTISDVAASSSFTGLTGDLTYNNNTGIILLSWSDSNSLVSSMRLLVQQERSNGILTICDTTTASSSGTITCNVSGYTGLITASAYRAASPAEPWLHRVIDLIQKTFYEALNTEGRANDGAILSFFILLTAAGMGAVSPIATIITGLFGLIAIFLFGITSFITITFVVSGVCLGLIVAFMVKK